MPEAEPNLKSTAQETREEILKTVIHLAKIVRTTDDPANATAAGGVLAALLSTCPVQDLLTRRPQLD
jgi:hypothetical protein